MIHQNQLETIRLGPQALQITRVMLSWTQDRLLKDLSAKEKLAFGQRLN